jgi:hypothetical protein
MTPYSTVLFILFGKLNPLVSLSEGPNTTLLFGILMYRVLSARDKESFELPGTHLLVYAFFTLILCLKLFSVTLPSLSVVTFPRLI